MKLILLILLNFTIYTQTIDLNGYWELVDYHDGKVQYKVTYGSTGAYSQGLFFTDSTVRFLDNIYFSNLLSDKYARSKEYKREYSGNYYNRRKFTISNNKLYIPLYGNDLKTELMIKKNFRRYIDFEK